MRAQYIFYTVWAVSVNITLILMGKYRVRYMFEHLKLMLVERHGIFEEYD